MAVGRRILPKAEVADEAADCMRLLSGRTHRVYTAVCIAGPKERRRERLVETACASSACRRRRSTATSPAGEWRGKAGGYAIQGLAGSFVVKLVGSYSAVVGLPLYETIASSTARAIRSRRVARRGMNRPAPAGPRPGSARAGAP